MKRFTAIFLTALLLFSMTACDFFSDDQKETDSEVFENGSESYENVESNKSDLDSDNSDCIESDNYSFISQEEKNMWRSDLITILSKSRVHEIEPYLPGSISVGLMDINFDNSPEVFVAYSGGSMNNINIEIYDLKSDSAPITYDGACYGGYYNICLYVADNDGEFVILSEGSLRIPETGWVTYICREQIDTVSQSLTGNILFEIASDLNLYACNGQVVDKAEYEDMYQQFLLDYKKIESTQIQMMRWSDIGEVEKREPQTKSSSPVYTREEIAEIMADALVSSSQQFIKYDFFESSDHPQESESNKSDTNEGTENNNTDKETEPQTKTELSEKYPRVPKAFDNILDAYVDIANLTRHEGYTTRESINDKDYPNVSKEHIDVIFNSLIDGWSWRNGVDGYFAGYAIKDVNGDGIPELFLTDVEYTIYAMFTLVNGEIISHYFYFYYNDASGVALDTNGYFYMNDFGKGECEWYQILRLGENGAFYGTEFGHYDMTGFGDPDVYNYYYTISDRSSSSNETSITDEEYNNWVASYNCPQDKERVIVDEEYNNLVASYNDVLKSLDPDGCGKPNHVTHAAGLEFYQVITEDFRK